jgi:hypothetical protein
MFEVLAVIVLLLAAFSVLIILPLLLVIKAVQAIFGPAVEDISGAAEDVRERVWRQADPFERERMVRKACGWRVIGRAVGAGALVTGAFFTASPVLTIMWCLSAWRVLKPVKREMRDACAYRSTGEKDEPRYW